MGSQNWRNVWFMLYTHTQGYWLKESQYHLWVSVTYTTVSPHSSTTQLCTATWQDLVQQIWVDSALRYVPKVRAVD